MSLELAGAVTTHIARRERLRVSRSRLYEDKRAMRLLLERMRERFPGEEDIALSSVTREDLLQIVSGLSGRLSAHSVNVLLASWRVFFGELAREGLLLFNPAEGLRDFRDRPLPRYVPTREEMRRLLSIPDTRTESGIRDRAMLELLYGSGLRRNELLRLQLCDVDLSGETAFIRSGKGQKDRVVPMTAWAALWIARYIRVRPPMPEAKLFLGIFSRRGFSHAYFRPHFRILFAKAGMERVTVHAIRHACALHLLEGGADVVSLAKLLGHASVETTARYLALSTRHLAKMIQRSHPRERRPSGVDGEVAVGHHRHRQAEANP